MNHPVIYLNKKEHPVTKASYILLFYKKNEDIDRLIKQNDWILYSKMLGAYCVPASDSNVGLLYELFRGVAILNKQYMYRTSAITADRVEISVAADPKRALAPVRKIGSVMLFTTDVKGQMYFVVDYAKNFRIKKILKSTDWLRYGEKQRVFYFVSQHRLFSPCDES